MRLKQHIKEGYYPPNTERSVNVPVDDAIKLIKQHCKSALSAYKSKAMVFRGLESDWTSFSKFVQPSKFNRVSANTNNIYTLILDNANLWAKYPKRSKSIICSTDPSRADSYGHLYIVFPKDGYKFGVCPKSDIWESFGKTIGYAQVFNSDFARYVREMGIDFKDNTIEDLKFMCKQLDLAIKNDPDALDYDSFEWKRNYAGDFMKLLEMLLNPNKNGFKVSNNIKDLPHSGSHEVWTDSDCYLMSETWLHDNEDAFI
jgi:hypothetical protein